jgi:hypothetical protein
MCRVPKGRLKVAQDAVLGTIQKTEPVPSGTAEIVRARIQPSLAGLFRCLISYPGLRPGLLSDVPSGLISHLFLSGWGPDFHSTQ